MYVNIDIVYKKAFYDYIIWKQKFVQKVSCKNTKLLSTESAFTLKTKKVIYLVRDANSLFEWRARIYGTMCIKYIKYPRLFAFFFINELFWLT